MFENYVACQHGKMIAELCVCVEKKYLRCVLPYKDGGMFVVCVCGEKKICKLSLPKMGPRTFDV